ncbi:hypothetical protein PEC18_37745 [Paucibacter sp. O1-1]|nr:hypothetical protein [Paucibacter sp. O1-1]MDA3831378.1 hypothetical protein [Paucibacter sp. O1-1]
MPFRLDTAPMRPSCSSMPPATHSWRSGHQQHMVLLAQRAAVGQRAVLAQAVHPALQQQRLVHRRIGRRCALAALRHQVGPPGAQQQRQRAGAQPGQGLQQRAAPGRAGTAGGHIRAGTDGGHIGAGGRVGGGQGHVAIPGRA